MKHDVIAQALTIIAATALAAGCLGGASEPEPAVAGVEATAADSGRAAADAGGPRILYFTAEGGVSDTPPTAEARVPLGMPVNHPEAEGYPVWSGELPATLAGATGKLTLHVYVAASAASVAANTLPVFATGPLEFPDFFVDASLGNLTEEHEAEGPDVLLPGDVVEVVVDLGALPDAIASGSLASLELVPTYAHVAGAAEFQIVIGPDHPMRVEIA